MLSSQFFSVRRCIICILICFMLLGLTSRAFSETCAPFVINWPAGQWTRDFQTFSSASEAVAYCQSKGGLDYFCDSPTSLVCENNPGYYACWHNNWVTNTQYFGAYCTLGTVGNCATERADAASQCGGADSFVIDEETCDWHCNACVEEAAQQCGGSDKVVWNNDGDCSYECIETCQEERDALELQCGGPDRYEINEDTCVGSCKPIDCSGAEWALYQMCGGDNYYIDPQTCYGYCIGDGCVYQAESECGWLGNVVWEDPDKCLFECAEATKQCQDRAKEECVDEENIEWIDKAKCTYKCISKCTDRDKDGVYDVCDYCPNNPEVSAQVKVIYRLNGDADICDTGHMTCDGRLIRDSDPGKIYRDVDTICLPSESVVVPCNMTEDCQKDTDGDGIPDGEDTDDDGDGIPDSEDTDDDGDGTPDSREDTDGDGIPDSIDPDDDGDGRPDRHDPDGDPDGDGKDNEHDDDDDGDGTPDTQDPDDLDCDEDGVVDSEDPDDDEDGIPDPYDTEKTCKEKDTDGDGIPDVDDPDDDGDGIPDVDDPDDDGDGTPDTDDPPDEPPPDDGGGDGGDGNGDVVIADCKIDISTLRSIVSADNGKFPFNWLWAFVKTFQPLAAITGSPAPEFKYTFTFFGQQKEIDLHLERFDTVAKVFRYFMAMMLIFYFMQFFVRLYNKVITGG